MNMRIQRNLLRGFVLTFLLTACSPFINHHAEGLRLLEAGRNAEAWEAFEKGYEKNPLSPFSLNNKGYVLEMRDEKLFEAAKFYRRAIAACEDQRDDKEVKRIEKMARENLSRVLWKIQAAPRWHVNVPDPKNPPRKS